MQCKGYLVVRVVGGKACSFDFSDLLPERLPEAECSTVLEYILTDKRRASPSAEPSPSILCPVSYKS